MYNIIDGLAHKPAEIGMMNFSRATLNLFTNAWLILKYSRRILDQLILLKIIFLNHKNMLNRIKEA